MFRLLLAVSMIPRAFNPDPSSTVPGPCTKVQHETCVTNCYAQKKSTELLADVTCRVRTPFDPLPDCTCHVMELIPDLPPAPQPDPVAR